MHKLIRKRITVYAKEQCKDTGAKNKKFTPGNSRCIHSSNVAKAQCSNNYGINSMSPGGGAPRGVKGKPLFSATRQRGRSRRDEPEALEGSARRRRGGRRSYWRAGACLPA